MWFLIFILDGGVFKLISFCRFIVFVLSSEKEAFVLEKFRDERNVFYCFMKLFKQEVLFLVDIYLLYVREMFRLFEELYIKIV